MQLTKQQAIAIFGSGAELGRAVGLSRARISQWPPLLEQRESDLVVGAELRLGRQIPEGASFHVHEARETADAPAPESESARDDVQVPGGALPQDGGAA